MSVQISNWHYLSLVKSNLKWKFYNEQQILVLPKRITLTDSGKVLLVVDQFQWALLRVFVSE